MRKQQVVYSFCLKRYACVAYTRFPVLVFVTYFVLEFAEASKLIVHFAELPSYWIISFALASNVDPQASVFFGIGFTNIYLYPLVTAGKVPFVVGNGNAVSGSIILSTAASVLFGNVEVSSVKINLFLSVG